VIAVKRIAFPTVQLFQHFGKIDDFRVIRCVGYRFLPQSVACPNALEGGQAAKEGAQWDINTVCAEKKSSKIYNPKNEICNRIHSTYAYKKTQN